MKKHNKILAIQGDPLSSINRKTDTTLLLALEAQRRKYKIYYYETKNVTFKNKKVYFRSFRNKTLCRLFMSKLNRRYTRRFNTHIKFRINLSGNKIEYYKGEQHAV